ncbi:hypothetical protein HpBHB29_08150 [Helicobacter pylori]|nr:hypothetical protein VN1258_12250 [Helicobacter pylori]
MLFGKFLEHYPYFGLRGKEDENSWNKASDLSEKVYEHHFKTKLYGMSDLRSCKSQKCWAGDDDDDDDRIKK